jgi:hypothetical protein
MNWAKRIGHHYRKYVALLFVLGSIFVFQMDAQGAGYGADSLASAAANIDDELVYLDPNGVIRVLDPSPAAGVPEVRWSSPGGGWRYIALGDFNADGDLEIAAVGGDGGNRLAIYDPVAEGLGVGQADGFINGIPWALLYEEVLPGPAYLVAAGDFDLSVPGDELVYYYALSDAEILVAEDEFRFVFMSAEGTPPTGRSWSTLLTYDSGNEWTWIGAGNLNGTGVDEVAVISRLIGNLSVYTISNGTLIRIFRNSDAVRAWQDGDIGQFVAGGDAELAAGRETQYPLPSLFVLQYAGGDWTDAIAEYNDPPPAAVFFGDLTGNGDDEVIALRSVRPEYGARPRLFVRDNGNDNVVLREAALDADNGYRTGVAGDIDGDGRDEIVVMRNNRIRIFTEPEASSSFTDYDVNTGSAMILAGNLDANGLSSGSRFGASPRSVEDTVISGTASQVHAISISDVVNGRSIPFTYSIENNSTWIRVTQSSEQTPSTLGVTLEATGLITGTFSDQLIIETDDGSVVNSPYGIDVKMTVQPGLTIAPSHVVGVQMDCQAEGQQPMIGVAIQGTPDAAYSLTFQPPVGWASVTPITGTIPASATLTLDGVKLGSGVGETRLVARADISGAEFVGRASVTLLCAESTIHLPIVSR